MQFPHKYFYISAISPIMVACQDNGLKKVVTVFETDPPPPLAWIFQLGFIIYPILLCSTTLNPEKCFSRCLPKYLDLF